MWFSAVEVPDEEGTVLAVTGDLDLASVPQFRRALRKATSPGRRLVVDLTGVDVIDSAGIGLLIGARARALATDGAFAVRCAPGRVADLLRVAGVDELLGLEVQG